MLKAILSCKMMTSDVYDVMKRVMELLVTCQMDRSPPNPHPELTMSDILRHEQRPFAVSCVCTDLPSALPPGRKEAEGSHGAIYYSSPSYRIDV
jgi:hypothetical protein